jgi:ribosomal-protein-alanine N-acetyltransferase
MEASLRIPELADYQAMTSWIPDAEACARWAGPHVPFPFSAEMLPELLSMPGGRSYSLIDPANQCIGFGQHWMTEPRNVHLGRIIVAPTMRGSGIGRILCELLIKQAVQTAGASTITLRVYRDNPIALSLYLSLGFGVVQPESTADILFMRRTAQCIF